MSLDEALALIDRCTSIFADGEGRTAALQYAADRAGVRAEEAVGSEPEPSGKALELFYDRRDVNGKAYRSKFKSLKQQRKVMALVRQGKVPYPRTGKLMASITSAAAVTDTGVVIRVGTNRPEGPYVLDESRQSHYHAGTWTPLQVSLRQHEGEIVDEFVASLRGYISGYVRGK